MDIYHFGNINANKVLIQMVDDNDLALIENEVSYIKEMSKHDDFHLIAIKTDNWNDDLSPYEAPPVFGKVGFAGFARRTLDYIIHDIVMPLKDDNENVELYIGGYSLAGLFALWASIEFNIFKGVAAASPSLWFPGFVDLMRNNRINTEAVYLSLGDKEEKAKNPLTATVGNAIREVHSILLDRNINTVLEWNEGNHFKDSELRTAKAFAWLLKNFD